MKFPLEGEFAREFAQGLAAVLVIEEKRSFLELHLRDALYSMAARPIVMGKTDSSGAPLFPPAGELDPDRIAKVVGALLGEHRTTEKVAARMHYIDDVMARPKE